MPEGFSWGELLLSFDLLLSIVSSFLSGYTRDVIPGFSWSNHLLVLLAYYHWFIICYSSYFSTVQLPFLRILRCYILAIWRTMCFCRFDDFYRGYAKKKLVRYEEKKCILSIVLFLFVFWNEMKNRNEIEMNKMAWLLFLRMIRKLFLLILMTPFWEIEYYLKKDS